MNYSHPIQLCFTNKSLVCLQELCYRHKYTLMLSFMAQSCKFVNWNIQSMHVSVILNFYNKIWHKNFSITASKSILYWCKQYVGILSMQSWLHNIFSHSVDGNEFQAPTVLSLLLIYITMWAEKVQFLSPKRFLYYQYFGCMCMYNIYSKPSIYWAERGGMQSCQMPITLNVCNLAAI